MQCLISQRTLKIRRSSTCKEKLLEIQFAQFRTEIEQQLQNGNNKLIIDLKNVPLLDSTALGVIIVTLQVLQRSGGKLVLLKPQKAVSSVLEVTRLSSILEVYETEEAALNAFS